MDGARSLRVFLLAAFVLSTTAAAPAMVTGSAPADTQPASLDLSRFNPAAAQLAGIENPSSAGLGAWTSSLSIACGPAFGPYGAGSAEPDTPFAPSALSPQSCANRQYGQDFAGSSFLNPAFLSGPFGQTVFPSSVVLPIISQTVNTHKMPSFSGLTTAGRAPAGFGSGALQVQVRQPAGSTAAAVKHPDVQVREVPVQKDR